MVRREYRFFSSVTKKDFNNPKVYEKAKMDKGKGSETYSTPDGRVHVLYKEPNSNRYNLSQVYNADDKDNYKYNLIRTGVFLNKEEARNKLLN